MNRDSFAGQDVFFSVPRAHGDEPHHSATARLLRFVFPVPTGMNRTQLHSAVILFCVPRAHGDEPVKLIVEITPYRCSPCPRG